MSFLQAMNNYKDDRLLTTERPHWYHLYAGLGHSDSIACGLFRKHFTSIATTDSRPERMWRLEVMISGQKRQMLTAESRMLTEKRLTLLTFSIDIQGYSMLEVSHACVYLIVCACVCVYVCVCVCVCGWVCVRVRTRAHARARACVSVTRSVTFFIFQWARKKKLPSDNNRLGLSCGTVASR
jgi:hypothetical protein